MSFSTLTVEDQKFLVQNGRLLNLPEGTRVFQEGDECQGFVILKNGSIRVQKVAENGRMIVLYRVDPDNLCILTTSCLLGGRGYDAEGICEVDTEALVLPKAKFQEILDHSAGFREFVFSSLASRLTGLIVKINQVALTNVETRLLILLLQKSQATGLLTMTHQDLASELGSAREVISRHLKRLEAQGLVRLGHGQIEILDVAALQKLRDLETL